MHKSHDLLGVWLLVLSSITQSDSVDNIHVRSLR